MKIREHLHGCGLQFSSEVAILCYRTSCQHEETCIADHGLNPSDIRAPRFLLPSIDPPLFRDHNNRILRQAVKCLADTISRRCLCAIVAELRKKCVTSISLTAVYSMRPNGPGIDTRTVQ